MTNLFEPLSFARGPAMKNRLALAPLTNQQSGADGRLSDAEFHWLTLRAKGGFGLTMTCAAHVQPCGQGFPGQLGIFGDEHVEGLARLAQGIKAHHSVAAVQLHHAGLRADATLVPEPVGPSPEAGSKARALGLAEVERLREDFIAAAARAEAAGFDGVEIHGAHGYLLTQFLSAATNRREDRYGGSLENRARLIFEIVDGVRDRCRPDFQVGLRLSPERFGLHLAEMRDLCAELLRQARIDYLDLSLWDARKMAEEDAGRRLIDCFTDLPRGGVRLGAAGKVMHAADAADLIEAGCDFAFIGRAAILRHDFPERVRRDAAYTSPALPVSRDHLAAEGLSEPFIEYMRGWPAFVAI